MEEENQPDEDEFHYDEEPSPTEIRYTRRTTDDERPGIGAGWAARFLQGGEETAYYFYVGDDITDHDIHELIDFLRDELNERAGGASPIAKYCSWKDEYGEWDTEVHPRCGNCPPDIWSSCMKNQYMEQLKKLALESANALWAIAEGKEPERPPKDINQDIYRMFGAGKLEYPGKGV